MEDFEKWWHNEGLLINFDENLTLHEQMYTISKVAWEASANRPPDDTVEHGQPCECGEPKAFGFDCCQTCCDESGE